MYTAHRERWQELLDELADEISARLSAKKIRGTVKRRVKALESLSQKQSRPKYQAAVGGEPVKDLLGMRIVVPFLEDTESVVEFLRDKYSVIEVERKSDSLSFREFAYDAVHLVIELQSHAEDCPLPKGLPLVCEVQVRTYLQEAWAEVEHELIYKSYSALPDAATQKKLAALNASLMLSDTVFQELRDHQRRQAEWGRRRFRELRRKAEHLNATLPSQESPHGEAPQSGRQAGVSPAESYLAEGVEAHNRREYEKAMTLYNKALRKNPKPEVRSSILNHLGMARFMLNDVKAAIDEFSGAFEANPQNFSALNNRALAWRYLGVVATALKDLDRSLEIQVLQPEVHFLKGQTFFELGDRHEEAMRELRRAIELQPKYPEAEALLERLIRADQAVELQ